MSQLCNGLAGMSICLFQADQNMFESQTYMSSLPELVSGIINLTTRALSGVDFDECHV